MFVRKSSFIVLILAAFAAVGQAVPVDVTCGSPGALQAAIDGLRAAGIGEVKVTGTCNESISVDGFRDLRIYSDSGATIKPGGAGQPGIQVTDGSHLKLCGLAIDGGRIGIVVASSRVVNEAQCLTKGLTVMNASEDGIAVLEGGVFQSVNGVPLSVKMNARRGVYIEGTSRVNLQGYTTTALIEQNGGGGVYAGEGSAVMLYYTDVKNNGGPGVIGATGSVVHVANSEVSDNAGWGVLLTNNSTGLIFGAASVTGNADGGILVTQTSSLRLRNAPVVSENAVSNLSCTAGGSAFGDATNVPLPKKDCRTFESLPN